MAAPVDVEIVYRGPGSLQQPAVAPPDSEVVRTSQMYEVGEEVRFRPGWFVHEVGVNQSGTMLRWIVELRRPDWWRGDADPNAPGETDDLRAE